MLSEVTLLQLAPHRRLPPIIEPLIVDLLDVVRYVLLGYDIQGDDRNYVYALICSAAMRHKLLAECIDHKKYIHGVFACMLI